MVYGLWFKKNYNSFFKIAFRLDFIFSRFCLMLDTFFRSPIILITTQDKKVKVGLLIGLDLKIYVWKWTKPCKRWWNSWMDVILSYFIYLVFYFIYSIEIHFPFRVFVPCCALYTPNEILDRNQLAFQVLTLQIALKKNIKLLHWS